MYRAKATIQAIIKNTFEIHKQYIDAQNQITDNPDINDGARIRMREEARGKYTAIVEDAKKKVQEEFNQLAVETAEEYRRKDAARYASRDYTPGLQATLQVLDASKCNLSHREFHAYVDSYRGDPVATAAINATVERYKNAMEGVEYKLPDERKDGEHQVEIIKKSVMNLLNNFTIGSGFPEGLLEPSVNEVCEYLSKCNDMLTAYSGKENRNLANNATALYRNYSTMAGYGCGAGHVDERKQDSKAIKAVW